jgi:hypothetical protein
VSLETKEETEYIYVLIRETPGYHHVKAGHPLPDWKPGQGDAG